MYTSPEDARQVWARAQSFAQLCELTIQFIEGVLPFFPTYGSPNEETNDIKSALVQLNRQGLLTTGSQPAMLKPDYAQRAWVEGFARKKTALVFAAKSLYSDVHIVVFPPRVERGYMIPITVADGRPYTWAGASAYFELEPCFKKVCNARAMRALTSAWYVVAIDLVWGRKEHLWEILLAANQPGYSARPHPDLGIEHEFYY